MKLIAKIFAICVIFVGFLACSNNNDTQHPTPLNKKVNTVKIIDQPVSVQRSKKTDKPIKKKVPCVSLQLPKKKAVYTNSNEVLKTRS